MVRGVFLSCSGVWVPCCLVCCRVVLFVLSLAVSRCCWLRPFCCCRAVPCCPVLFLAVLHPVWCHRAVWCVVVFSLLLCGVVLRFVVWLSGPLRRAALRRVCWSVMLCPLPPADALVVGLLLLPGPLSWPVLVLCPGLRCFVALLCHLSWVVLLFGSFLAVWCSVALFALAGAVCCWVLFLGVHRWVWLSLAICRFFTGVCSWCIVCAVFLASRRLITGVRA